MFLNMGEYYGLASRLLLVLLKASVEVLCEFVFGGQGCRVEEHSVLQVHVAFAPGQEGTAEG